MSNFNAFMAGSLETRKDWFVMFPVDKIILDGARTDDTDSTLLVDIGGGEGHDIDGFHKAFQTPWAIQFYKIFRRQLTTSRSWIQ